MAKKGIIYSAKTSVFSTNNKSPLFGKPSHNVVGSKDTVKKLLSK